MGLHDEEEVYRVEEELYDSADFPMYKLSDGRTVSILEEEQYRTIHDLSPEMLADLRTDDAGRRGI